MAADRGSAVGAPAALRWQCGRMSIDLGRPLIMGILNVTPDSFADGGRYLEPAAALDHALELIEEGADIIDVGGESTRPGSLAVEAHIECRRIIPVIEGLAAAAPRVPISVDTTKLEVMQAASRAGAVIVNDVRALAAPGAREWAAQARVGVCLMHMQGEPRTMQVEPRYHEVVAEVAQFLRAARAAAIEAGIAPEAIVLDPGLGFGKRPEHNLALLKHLDHLIASLNDAPFLIGASRKSLIARVLGTPDRAATPGAERPVAPGPAGPAGPCGPAMPEGAAPGRTPTDERLYGGLGIAAWAVSRGARIVRTHDVAATRDAVRLVSAVMQGAVR
jgi:dihydropteroate synthase